MPGPMQQPQGVGQGQGMPATSGGPGGMQDPMSALRTLAQHGGGVTGPITSMAVAMPQNMQV